MTIIRDYPHLLHGGDYNPDQWLDRPDVLDADFRLMDQAGCNAFSVGIFAWVRYEAKEGLFDFAWMDDIFERAARGGKKLFLATPSGARPDWLGINYPETNRVNAEGRRLPWGNRHNHCWTSPVMREKTWTINGKLAERYAKHPALGGWHISNEYNGDCHCPLCRKRFARYLEDRYGTLDAMNAAYWSAFWSHSAGDWHCVNPDDHSMDGARLDWRRFTTARVVDFLQAEIAALRQFSDAPVTTNMMGFFDGLDYWLVAECCDFVADDCYPMWTADNAEAVALRFSATHAMHYSMKNKPFAMLESAPGTPNYNPHPRIRRDGELEREALLALGHGADGIMYFQWRKGRNGCEKFHGAVVGHDGGDRPLVFRRVAELGRGLARVAGLVDATRTPEVAVVHDWESRWALETSHGFADAAKRQVNRIVEHYGAFWRRNVPAALIESRSDFSPYKLLVLPMLFMFRDGLMERLTAFVENGGTVVMTCLSAYVDENNRCFEGGNPGGPAMRRLFGIWNEDIDGMAPADKQALRLTPEFALPGPDGANGRKRYEVTRLAEYIHAEGATVAATFEEDILAGRPALTVNTLERGRAWYVAGETGADFLDDFLGHLADDLAIAPVLPDLPKTVRAGKRSKDGKDYFFLLNMTAESQTVTLPYAMIEIWRDENSAPTRAVTLPPNGGTMLLADSR